MLAPEKESESTNQSSLMVLPLDARLIIANFLTGISLLNLGLVNRSFYNLTLAVRWQEIINTGNSNKLIKFFYKMRFSPKSLDVTFFPRITDEKEGLKRLLPDQEKWSELEKFSNRGWRMLVPSREEKHFSSRGAYFGYLLSNVFELILVMRGALKLKDENDRIFRDLCLGPISVFQAFILMDYKREVADKLDHLVEQKIKLPLPYKTEEHFKDFPNPISAYFEYLIFNIHDLYIALRNHPELINKRDEKGQTLLFYPIMVAPYLSLSSINWLIHILTSVPNTRVDTVDVNGDTFLHVTARLCAGSYAYREGTLSVKPNPLPSLFSAFTEFAVKNNFHFQTLNRQGFSVLHVAMTVSSHQANCPLAIMLKIRSKYREASVDPNQLSAEGFTPLYYALREVNFRKIQELLRLTKPDNILIGRELALLKTIMLDTSFHLKRSFENDLPYRKEYIYKDPYYSALNNMIKRFHYIKHLQMVYLSLIARMTEQSFELEYENVAWLNEDMINDILHKVNQNNKVVNYLKLNKLATKYLKFLNDRTISAKDKENSLWEFLTEKFNCPLSLAIISTYKEELDRINQQICDTARCALNTLFPLKSVTQFKCTFTYNIVDGSGRVQSAVASEQDSREKAKNHR